MALARDDWAQAGLEALTREGLAGVAIEPLARALGTTKGSFYWHFRNREELIAASLALWERRETEEVLAALPPLAGARERLIALGAGAYAGAADGNAHPAILAATDHPVVREVLERVTGARLRALTELYAELGLSAADAATYAQLAYALYLGIGELRRTTGARREDLDPVIELALQRAMPTVPPSASGQ